MKTNRTKISMTLLLVTALGFQGLMISVSGCSGGAKKAGNTVNAGGKNGASGATGATKGAAGSTGNGTSIVPTGVNTGGDNGSSGATGSTGSPANTPPPAPSYYEYAFVKMDTVNATTISNLYWGDTKGSAPKPLTAFTAASGMVLPFWNGLVMTPDAATLFYLAAVNQGLTAASLDVKSATTTPVTAPKPWGSAPNAALTLFTAPLPDGAHVLSAAYDSGGGCTLRNYTLDGTSSTIVRDPGKHPALCQGNQCVPNEFNFGLAASQVTNPADPAHNLFLFSVGDSQAPNAAKIDLWISKIDGTLDDAANLTKTLDVAEIEPSFSPDGKKVLFSESKKDPNPPNKTIHRVSVCDLLIPTPTDLTTAKLQNCKETTGDAVSPSWSCDGRKIFYIVPTGDLMVDQNAKGQLYWMNPDLTGAAALTDASMNVWSPAGSPKCPL